MTLAPHWPNPKLKWAGPTKKFSDYININKMDFLVPTIDSDPWDINYAPSDMFDFIVSTLKQADSTTEDIYNLYYSPPIVDYKWMDASKEATVGCDGWGNQQSWTPSWLLEQIHSDTDKRALFLLCVHAHSLCTVTNKELETLRQPGSKIVIQQGSFYS